jgi:threonylcarbamoyladenosine tRNA methylthiotransferase MtaB
MKFKLHTYGCKVNTYDSGLLQARLTRGGLESARASEPEVHILNTCAVTKEATREAVKTARRLKAKNPLAMVVVTGCAAQVDTEEFTHVPGVDLVVANSHKGQLEKLIRDYSRGLLRERVFKSNIFKKDDLEAGGGLEPGHTRAFLKIQDGCDSFCTFCVIPFARGKSRSIPAAEMVRRIVELEAQGIREVVLTGVHIGDYRDGERGLEDLIERILLGTRVSRLRLSSLEPPELTPRLLELYRRESRLCRHFHMSIQSANSKVLFEMKRQYTADAVERALTAIHEDVPGSYVGMDVIAGFPGESDDEFLDSLKRLRRLPWTRLHVFPYSARPGTFAARRSDAVDPRNIKLRARLLRELSLERLSSEALSQVGSLKQALSLRDGSLLTSDYWPVELDRPWPTVNEELMVEILGVGERSNLRGRAIGVEPRSDRG